MSNFCGEASIIPTDDNKSWALSNDANDPCSTSSNTWNAPTGFLGVNAYGYFQGALCGDTGNYFNAAATYNFGVGEVICGDQGCGNYFTHATQSFGLCPIRTTCQAKRIRRSRATTARRRNGH